MRIRSTLALFASFSFVILLTPNFVTSAVAAPIGSRAADAPTKLQEQSRLAIIRYVDGEFAKAATPLPRGKKGFKLVAGKPLNIKELKYDLRTEGVCANQGDRVQITKVEFRAHEIVFQINGGGKKPFHLLQHVQIGMGGGPSTPLPERPDNPQEGNGTTLILDFGAPLPDMSPDDLKKDLSPLLDFSNEHSATVNWIDTLPPQFQEAIKNHQALAGMNQETVIAALGRTDHKVRERDPETGQQTEDWIYGNPPARTTFVTFVGDKVIRVKVFN